MTSVSDNPVIVLNIDGELPPITQNETSWITNFYRFPVITASRLMDYLKRMWTEYFRPGTLGENGAVLPVSVTDNPVAVMNINAEDPNINNQKSFPAKATIIPGPTFNFVIIGLFSFTAIKSQGDTKFPFHSNPKAITVAVNSLIVYGLASAAEDAISAARPGPKSVYASIARFGRKLCLFILVCSLASLFYL